MDYQGLSELMFPQITKTIADYEELYPQRDLPEGARVTRWRQAPQASSIWAIYTERWLMNVWPIRAAAFFFCALKIQMISAK